MPQTFLSRLYTAVSDIVSALGDVVYPPVCEVCGRTLGRSEQVFCASCRRNMPRITDAGDNTLMHRRLVCSMPVQRVAAMFRYYRGTPYTALIRNAKYHHRPRIMHVLGNEFAEALLPTGFFRGIDVVLPVPMHPLKKLRRGFNQTDMLAAGVSQATGLPVGDNLVALRTHASQTRRTTLVGRNANVRSAFAVRRPEQLCGLHVLLVDDVLTTGATLRSAIDTLASGASPSQVSVLTLAAVPDV